MTTIVQAPPARAVPTRRISFEATLAGLPRHFAAGGDLLQSHLAAALSSVFPDGEDFFVRSVRRYRDELEDPDLRRQVAGFIGQEAMHGREHRALNRHLAHLGYPSGRFETVTRVLLGGVEKVGGARASLAVTAALEHFTATLAEVLLSDEDARALFGQDALRDLFLWHALEESEHKAVAFDVYRAVGGGERMRRVVMDLVTAGFLVGVAVLVADSLAHDRAAYRRGALRASWRRLRRSPMVSAEVWRRLRAYDRVGFHPDERDTAALMGAWREELFGSNGRLKDLPTAAA